MTTTRRPTQKKFKRTWQRKPRSKYVTPSQVAKIARNVVQRSAEVKNTSYQWNSIGGTIGAIVPNTIQSVSFGSGALVACLCQGIGASAGFNGRIGNEIYLKNIEMSFSFEAGDAYNYLRLLLVRPKGQFINSNPTPAAFVQSLMSGNGSSSNQYNQPTDDENFEIWSDDMCPLQKRVGAASSGNSDDVFVPYIYQRTVTVNRKVRYQESTGNVDRDFFLVAISDSTIGPNPGATAGYVKLRWTDI